MILILMSKRETTKVNIIRRIERLEKKVKFLREDMDYILKAFRRAKEVWKKLMKRGEKK